MANTNPETKVQAPSVAEEAFPPTYASAEEAWDDLLRECGITEADADLCRGVFMAGMSAALSISYHHGFEALRAELVRVQKVMAS